MSDELGGLDVACAECNGTGRVHGISVDDAPWSARCPACEEREDRIDSGMEGRLGKPYTVDEAENALGMPNLTEYHRELLRFLVRRVRRLEGRER